MPTKKTAAEGKEEKNISFETAIARLEEIVRSLENGSAELDKSLEMFEEGAGLVRLCNEKLDKAERRIKALYKKEDGTYGEKNFDGKEDN